TADRTSAPAAAPRPRARRQTRTRRARVTARAALPCHAKHPVSSRAPLDHLDTTWSRELHAKLLASDFLDAAWRRPGAALELQLPVFDVVGLGLLLLALELYEELARLVARVHERKGARDAQR